MKQQVKQVPYGVSDFATVMSQNLYYVDKTMFLPERGGCHRNHRWQGVLNEQLAYRLRT